MALEGHEDGFFVGPTLFDHVSTDMRIYKAEIFGPVLVVTRAHDLDEAIEIINRNPWGNGAAIFTCDGNAARAFPAARERRNGQDQRPDPGVDGLLLLRGLEGLAVRDIHMHGPEGLRFNTRGKVVSSRWPVSADAKIDVAFTAS